MDLYGDNNARQIYPINNAEYEHNHARRLQALRLRQEFAERQLAEAEADENANENNINHRRRAARAARVRVEHMNEHHAQGILPMRQVFHLQHVDRQNQRDVKRRLRAAKAAALEAYRLADEARDESEREYLFDPLRDAKAERLAGLAVAADQEVLRIENELLDTSNNEENVNDNSEADYTEENINNNTSNSNNNGNNGNNGNNRNGNNGNENNRNQENHWANWDLWNQEDLPNAAEQEHERNIAHLAKGIRHRLYQNDDPDVAHIIDDNEYMRDHRWRMEHLQNVKQQALANARADRGNEELVYNLLVAHQIADYAEIVHEEGPIPAADVLARHEDNMIQFRQAFNDPNMLQIIREEIEDDNQGNNGNNRNNGNNGNNGNNANNANNRNNANNEQNGGSRKLKQTLKRIIKKVKHTRKA